MACNLGFECNPVTTITDFNDAATPVLILAYSSDNVSLAETGSDTLTTLGHIYSTVTYNYNEQTSDNSTVSEANGAAGWSAVSSASEQLQQLGFRDDHRQRYGDLLVR